MDVTLITQDPPVHLPSPDRPLIIKLGFLVGWMCFALAFILTAAEASLGNGFITPLNDLLISMDAGKWIAFKVRHASPFFDGFILPIFQLPGWLLAGVPAGVLIWTCRPHQEPVDPELYNSLTTYDRLAKLADEEGALHDDPTFNDFDQHDYGDPLEISEDDISETSDTPETSVSEPKWPLSPEEKMQKARDNLPIPFNKLS